MICELIVISDASVLQIAEEDDSLFKINPEASLPQQIEE